MTGPDELGCLDQSKSAPINRKGRQRIWDARYIRPSAAAITSMAAKNESIALIMKPIIVFPDANVFTRKNAVAELAIGPLGAGSGALALSRNRGRALAPPVVRLVVMA